MRACFLQLLCRLIGSFFRLRKGSFQLFCLFLSSLKFLFFSMHKIPAWHHFILCLPAEPDAFLKRLHGRCLHLQLLLCPLQAFQSCQKFVILQGAGQDLLLSGKSGFRIPELF